MRLLVRSIIRFGAIAILQNWFKVRVGKILMKMCPFPQVNHTDFKVKDSLVWI